MLPSVSQPRIDALLTGKGDTEKTEPKRDPKTAKYMDEFSRQ